MSKRLRRRWLPRLCALGLAAFGLSAPGCGTLDPSGFHGWMLSFEGYFDAENEAGALEEFVQTSHFPCVDCYQVGTELSRREISMRFVNQRGHRVRLRFSLENLNEDGALLSFTDIPQPVVNESFASADPPAPGHAAMYINGVPVDEGGELEVFNGNWPLYPGDQGRTTLRFHDVTFEGRAIDAAFVVGLYVTEGSDIPPDIGGLNQPCAGYVCNDDAARCVEEDMLMCRRACDPGYINPGCEDGQFCVAIGTVAGVCRDGDERGTRDRPCRGGNCDDDMRCNGEVIGNEQVAICRVRCDTDDECGPGAECDGTGFCKPTFGLGFRDGPCVGQICVTGDLVCVDEPAGDTCRQLCTPGGDDVCGFRSRCIDLPGELDGACFPASGQDGPCPCDDGFTCATVSEPLGPLCYTSCAPADADPGCPTDRPVCAPLVEDPARGICLQG